MRYALIADIGGTNARFALAPLLLKDELPKLTEDSIFKLKKYSGTDFDTVNAAIEFYFSELAQELGDEYQRPSVGLIAIAAAVDQDQVSMVNHYWSFSKTELQTSLNFDHFYCINDFNAQACALPFYDESNLVHIGGANASQGTKIVTGPGTGLGLAALTYQGDSPVVIETEAGHSHFSPANNTERAVAAIIEEEFGRCSNERLICGTGLPNLYAALSQVTGLENQSLAASDITALAIKGEDELSKMTLDFFCKALGSFAGDQALSMASGGGVFISGGIIPRFIEYFSHSGFYDAFVDKGRMQAWMEKVPCYVVTAQEPGLLGAAAAVNYRLLAQD
jgi:glucokinase